MKIKKSVIYLSIIGILAVLLIWSVVSNEKIVVSSGSAASDSILYLMPVNCQTCDINDIKELTKNIDADVISYEANFIRTPLVLYPQNNTLSMLDATTKSSLAKDLCAQTNDQELCDLSASLVCEDVKKVDTPNFKLFYMSYCPYGQQAFKSVAEVAKLLGNSAEIEPHFVIYENYAGGGDDYCIDGSNLCSMHGIAELNEDIREACVYKYDKDKFWDYGVCVMDTCSLQNVESCWKTCADKYSIDTSKIETCLTEEGVSLMTAEKALDAKYGASGSPTIILNEAGYSGGRSPEEIKQSICCGFNKQPAACSQTISSNTAASSGSC